MLLLFLLTAALIKPVFLAGYMQHWGSIEGSFIADARFLRDHWPLPKWNPLWYSGTREDYIYAYGLRLGPAAISRWTGLEPVRAYHFYMAVFYCFGIAAVYLLARVATGWRGGAWLTAVAVALVSPSFLLFARFRQDAQFLEPLRLGVMLRYGEGPHISSLAWIPFALAFTWRALRGGRNRDLVLAALGSALVVWHNFYGATALAIMYAAVAWAVCITENRRATWLRALAIPAAAYGLLAFWLVPSYIAITRRNVQYVSEAPTSAGRWLAPIVFFVFLLLTWFIARGRRERAWPVALAGLLILLLFETAAFEYFGLVVWGSPHRHVPELDIAIILAVVEVIRRLPRRRVAISACLLLLAFAARRYVRHAWELVPLDAWWQERIEYRVQDWVKRNQPNSRAFVGGSTRFWYSTWNDLQQVDGAQHPGILNPSYMRAFWEIHLGQDGELSKQWLQLFGADLIAVHGPKSQEPYRDHQHPEKFAAVLPVLQRLTPHDIIYDVPRRYRSLARVVESAKLDTLPPIEGNGTRASLQPWVDLFEHGPEAPTETHWEGTDVLHVKARVPRPGLSVLVQVSYDRPWHAWSGSTELPVREGALGFMRIDAPPGEHDIRLMFTTPVENIVGRAVTVLTLAGIAWLAVIRFRSRRSRA
ncbi:MAG TPA: hypothetical protein VFL57_00890 [Bryobacteraceae bacterium]|nr:hypothetical protein [Bryobacteraceae bacterium]